MVCKVVFILPGVRLRVRDSVVTLFCIQVAKLLQSLLRLQYQILRMMSDFGIFLIVTILCKSMHVKTIF